MSHLSSSEVELDGVKARVVIEQSDDHPDYVRVTLCITPPNRGMDEYPYSAAIKKPAARESVPMPPCRETLEGREARCNGGGYDGCACGPWTSEQARRLRHETGEEPGT